MNDKAYCSACRENVDYKTVEEETTTDLDGASYRYIVKRAICDQCGGYATSKEHQQFNQDSFNDAVRKSQNIVGLSVIRELPKRYRIGKRPLSLLLGWGEHTYSRYIEGAVPNQRYSSQIQLLHNDPKEYLRFLEENKDRISDVAYRKSKEAVRAVLENDYPENMKLYSLADKFVICAGGDITNQALQKLVYYAQGFSAALLGHPIISNCPKAWVLGPVYGALWHEYKDNEEAILEDAEDESPFSSEEDRLIEQVYNSFGVYSGPMLSEMTHSEAPWLMARERAGVHEGESCSERIRLSEIESYFKQIISAYSISTIGDIENYPRRRIKQIRAESASDGS